MWLVWIIYRYPVALINNETHYGWLLSVSKRSASNIYLVIKAATFIVNRSQTNTYNNIVQRLLIYLVLIYYIVC